MDSSPDSLDPEVTIEPADNGYIVRHYQRGQGKDQSGRTIRRVASTSDEALEHAGKVLGGGGRMRKKASTRSLGRDGTDAAEAGEQSSSPAAHSAPRGRGMRRRPVRSRRRG